MILKPALYVNINISADLPAKQDISDRLAGFNTQASAVLVRIYISLCRSARKGTISPIYLFLPVNVGHKFTLVQRGINIIDSPYYVQEGPAQKIVQDDAGLIGRGWLAVRRRPGFLFLKKRLRNTR